MEHVFEVPLKNKVLVNGALCDLDFGLKCYPQTNLIRMNEQDLKEISINSRIQFRHNHSIPVLVEYMHVNGELISIVIEPSTKVPRGIIHLVTVIHEIKSEDWVGAA